jgi:hypothetical protein
MGRWDSNRDPRILRALVHAAALVLLVAGCESGLPPTHLISPSGAPEDFLPEGVVLGTVSGTDSLYFYDPHRFALYNYVTGTPVQFIKRGRTLSIVGATLDQINHPDQVAGSDGDVLRSVYSRPSLFGFEPVTEGNPGFRAGATVSGASQFLPLSAASGPSWWDYNHVQFLWTRRDTLVGRGDASTGSGWRLRSQNRARATETDTFIPSLYNSDLLVDVVPGSGIFFRGWTLTAERDEILPPGVFGTRQPQRNPRFLWVSKGTLGAPLGSVPDPNQSTVTTVDQCVDDMWGDVQLFPVQMCGADFQVGDQYVTWTYVSTDSAEIRRRSTQGSDLEELRCSGTGTIPDDIEGRVDNALFPVFYLSLLARYEIDVENVYDQLEWRLGNTVVGLYGPADGVIDVVKLAVTVTLGSPKELIVQKVDLYLQRGIGIVVQVTGIPSYYGGTNLFDVSRLRECMVDGVHNPAFFFYADQ